MSLINLQMMSDIGIDFVRQQSFRVSLIIDEDYNMWSPYAGLSMIAAAMGVAVPGEVMTGDQLAALAERVRAYVPRDQFDTPPQMASVAGKRFTYVVIPLQTGPDNAICRGFATWSYWANDQRLEVAQSAGSTISYGIRSKNGPLFPSEVARVGHNSELTFDSFTCRKIKEPGYIATNGFGARFDVKKETDIVTSIASLEPITHSFWRSYWTTQVAGEAARELSKNIRVRVSGSLDDWAPGKTVLCGTEVSSPTIDLPQESTLDMCMFKGRADHMEVINGQTGEVLYSVSR